MSGSLPEPFASLHIIDADSHYSEPYDLWTSRAPKKYVEDVPQVRNGGDGRPEWFIRDKSLSRFTGASFVSKEGDKILASSVDIAEGIPWEEIHESSYEVPARLDMMDDLHIWAQIVYPNALGFAAPALVQMLDRDLARTIVEIYNDAIAEWQDQSKGRLFPQAVLPFWNVEDSVHEAERIKKLGLKGITMAGNPQLGGLPDLGQPEWDPLYEALTDLELPINIHIGTGNVDGTVEKPGAWASLGRRQRASVNPVKIELANSQFIANLVVSDVLLRWPQLKWVSVESGVGWIPFVLERVDYTMREEFPGIPPQDHPPALEMFRRNIYACFWFEETAPAVLIERLGVDNIMWETDFPHPTCLYPSPVERAAETLSHLEPASIKKLMQDNAASLYKIDLPN